MAQIHTLIDYKLSKELGSGYSAPKQIILYQSQNRVLLLDSYVPIDTSFVTTGMATGNEDLLAVFEEFVEEENL